MSGRRIPRVRQFDQADCGAACLASVCRHYGFRVPITRIRQYAGTDAAGTSMMGMVRAAERLGFVAQGVRAAQASLPEMPLPAIAHLVTAASATHFVVVYRVDDRSVLLMDPAGGVVRSMSLEDFSVEWTGVLLLMRREAGAPAPLESVRPVGRLAAVATTHRRSLVVAVLGSLTYTTLTVSTAIFVQKVLDDVLPGGDLRLLGILALAMLVIALVRATLRYARDMVLVKAGQTLDRSLLGGFFAHLLRLPQQFFDTMRVGEIVSRLNDAVRIRVFLNDVLLQVVVNSLVVLLSLALMIAYSPRLAVLVGCSIPLYAVIYLLTNRANRRDQRETMVAAAEFESHVVESIDGVATIRGLGLQKHTFTAAQMRLEALLKPVLRSGRTAALSGAGAELVSHLAMIALLWLGAVMVVRQELTLGELMSFFTLSGYLAPPLLSLLAANRQVQDALIATERLFEVMDLEQEAHIEGVPTPTSAGRGVRLEGVYFRYGSRSPLFRGLTFSISPGSLTAIVGRSGSGKSTIASLLQRQRLPERGSIHLGDIDIDQLSLSVLRRRVAVVPQEVTLFSGTLVENVAPGDSDPDQATIVRLLESLALGELLRSLPQGLQTPLGGRGLMVSGGQRQRIAIARALYRESDVLVLDEATAGLDAATELAVLTRLRALTEAGRTVVMITHRLSSVMDADRIVVIDEGQVVGEGTHAELLVESSLYATMWDAATTAPARSVSSLTVPTMP